MKKLIIALSVIMVIVSVIFVGCGVRKDDADRMTTTSSRNSTTSERSSSMTTESLSDFGEDVKDKVTGALTDISSDLAAR